MIQRNEVIRLILYGTRGNTGDHGPGTASQALRSESALSGTGSYTLLTNTQDAVTIICDFFRKDDQECIDKVERIESNYQFEFHVVPEVTPATTAPAPQARRCGARAHSPAWPPRGSARPLPLRGRPPERGSFVRCRPPPPCPWRRGGARGSMRGRRRGGWRGGGASGPRRPT